MHPLITSLIIFLVIFVFVALLYVLRRPSSDEQKSAHISLILNLVFLVVALASLVVAYFTYTGAEDSGRAQQKTRVAQQQILSSSRTALESIIMMAGKQQHLLDNMLITLKAQHKLIAQQAQEEKERRARKPKIEIITNGISESEMQELCPTPRNSINGHILFSDDFKSEPKRKFCWNPDSFRFLLKNVGNAALVNPVVSITAYPVYVYLSRDSQIGTNYKEHHIQLTLERPITPYANTNVFTELPTIFRKLPSSIKSWELAISVFGDDYRHDFSIYFTAPSPAAVKP